MQGFCRMLAFLVFLGSSHTAVAQEAIYSADSLIATFQKGSKISLKGTEIRFAGIIVEIKKTQVTFRSSENDRVICELVTPMVNGSKEHGVGSQLTVVGRVRGRGILGNVTLDQCSLALSVALSDTTRGSSEAIQDEPTT